jgi:hypothetical protein
LNDSLESLVEGADLQDDDAPLVKALIDRGAKPSYELASVVTSPPVLKLLLSAGAQARLDTLRSHCRVGTVSTVRILLDAGAPLHSSAMEEAYEHSRYDICRLLFDRGASALPLLTVNGALRPRVRNILTPEEIVRVKDEFRIREVMNA